MSTCLQCGSQFAENVSTVNSSWGEWTDFFCSPDCRNESVYTTLTERICARDGCNRRVPERHRMLCLRCYQNDANLGERGWFSFSDQTNWQGREQAIRMQIENKVRVYSAQELTQEELRALVPSLQEEVA